MSSTLSDPYLFVAFWTGVGALLLTVGLGAQIVLLRMGLRRREALQARTIATWRPLLSAAVSGAVPETLPRLSRQSRIPFLKLWIHLHASLRGEASAGLNDIARRLHCDDIARKLLKQGSKPEYMLAVLALGYLRDRQSLEMLGKRLRDKDGVTSLYAAWALVQIDASAAARALPELVVSREDWPLSQVVAILQEGGQDCAVALVDTIAGLNEHHLLRALRIVEGMRATLPVAVHERLLAHDAIDVIVAALRLASTPGLLPVIRQLALHPDWRVRVQAAKALGRIGERSDAALLQQLLADGQWWVRYRAAQSLAALPFLGREDLDAIAGGTVDRYAADMVRHVLAEGGRE